MIATDIRRNPLVAILATLCALWATGVASAQSGSSTLIGTLTDPGDAVLPNAIVTVTEVSTGRTLSAPSNASGLFRILNLTNKMTMYVRYGMDTLHYARKS